MNFGFSPHQHLLFWRDVASLCTQFSAIDCHCLHPKRRISNPKLFYRLLVHRQDAVDCIRCWILSVNYHWIGADRVVGTFVDSVSFHFDCFATVNVVYWSYWFSDTLACRRWWLYLVLVSLGHQNTSNRHRPCIERPHTFHRNDIAAQIFSATTTDVRLHTPVTSGTLCTNNILNRIIDEKK